ncbi:MAG: SDR family NAD(P)-dependent oxidoreductase [Nitrospinae bacterium]|nr:SDR family NAD(P)-dependent oxidoreductase [Nitrospinota bacterium]
MTGAQAGGHPEYSGKVAVTGMALRMPGANTPAEFWANICDGKDCITAFSREALIQAGVKPAIVDNPDYVRSKGIIDAVEMFDAAFFGYSPREAELMDPQGRIFLECAWEAMEDAGYAPGSFHGAAGVFAGAGMNTYLASNVYPCADLSETSAMYLAMTGNSNDFLATRVCYAMNFTGPGVTVQTACSTSLVAAHMACQSLLGMECDMALAGGVAIRTPYIAGYMYQEGMILSPDGKCRAFDAKAKGTVPGSGAGVVVLKRLEDAIADGDRIYAVISGSAINNDGSAKAGYTAPGVEGQSSVIREAHAVAGIEPSSITYVETHGTGTTVGDPIEISALNIAFGAGAGKRGCAIGSVKSNIGHLDAAAGVAGLIKTALALHNRKIPPSAHFNTPNPAIDFSSGPFYMNTSLCGWISANGAPRRAGVSSFGVGGTNAHMVLEEAPQGAVSGPSRPLQVITVSARSSEALARACSNLADRFRDEPSISLPDAAYTQAAGRKIFGHRRALVCGSAMEAADALEQAANGPGVESVDDADIPIVLMFPGQGAQHVDMGRKLYEAEPVFREAMDRCFAILKKTAGFDLRGVMHPERATPEAAELINKTEYAQPALFATGYALAELWAEWGAKPSAMIGHSVGEYVAACIAGVFPLEEALPLVAGRGRLMGSMEPGAMAAVMAGEDAARAGLMDGLSIAAVNAPEACVVSGPEKSVKAYMDAAARDGLACAPLHVSHAFHSAMMEPAAAPLCDLAGKLKLNAPTIPFVSNVTGGWITPAQAQDPGYWGTHLMKTVMFGGGIATIAGKLKNAVFIDAGAGRTLCSLAARNIGPAAGFAIIPSMPHPKDGKDGHRFILEALAKVWQAGGGVDWTGFYKGEKRQRIALPTYPFERKRHWLEPAGRGGDAKSGRADISKWLYAPSWTPSLPPVIGNERAPELCVVFGAAGLGEDLIKNFSAAGRKTIFVTTGDGYAENAGGSYTVNPASKDDYVKLFSRIQPDGGILVAHTWLAEETDGEEADLKLGYYSLLGIVQALDETGIIGRASVCVVTRGVFDVTGKEDIHPARAAVLGPILSAPREYPGLTTRCVDIGGVRPDVESIAREILHGHGQVAAIRDGRGWTQGLSPVPLSSKSIQPLREGGVYVITGGLGAIGHALAVRMAKTARVKLALIVRSPLPPREQWAAYSDGHPLGDPVSLKIARAMEIEKLAERTLVIAADMGDEKVVADALAKVEKYLGAVNGVVHCAGETGEISLKTLSQTDFQISEANFAPKGRGALAIEKALRGKNPDFCVLMSSLASMTGGVGFTAYSAANAYMDAVAVKAGRESAARWITINWDGWRHSAGKVLGGIGNAEAESLLISPDEGVYLFFKIVADPWSARMVVSVVNLAERDEIIGGMRKRAFTHTAVAQNGNGRKTATHPPRNEVEKSLALMWTNLLGVETVGIHDDFFEMGGHSLLATQIISRVKKEFGVECPQSAIFQYPTVARLAGTISGMQLAEKLAGVETGDPPAAREEMEL